MHKYKDTNINTETQRHKSWDEINVCLCKNELSLMEKHKSAASGKPETTPLFWESLVTKYKDNIDNIHNATHAIVRKNETKTIFI